MPQGNKERFYPQDLLNRDGSLNAAAVSAALRFLFDVFYELRPDKNGPQAKRFVSILNIESFPYYIWVDIEGHLRYNNSPPTDPEVGDLGGSVII